MANGRLYEIRSALAPSKMTLDVRGGGDVNGANVQIYAVNHGNAQKFYVCDEGDGCSIRALGSGRYVDVYDGDVSTPGANVQIYDDNDTRAQRWKMTKKGTQTVDGVTCDVVTFGAGNGSACVLDVHNSVASNSTNVQIWTSTGATAQLWVLYPTTALDSNLPVPDPQGMSTELGGAQHTSIPFSNPITVYPRWAASSSWAGQNAYEITWKYRYLRGTDQKWSGGAGGQQYVTGSGWKDVDVYSEVGSNGLTCWDRNGITIDYDFADGYKEYEVYYRVRAKTADGSVVSDTDFGYCFFPRNPQITVTSIGWAGDGLHIGFTSDYPWGLIDTETRSVKLDGVEVLKQSAKMANGTYNPTTKGSDGSFIVPVENLTAIPKDGAKVELSFRAGTDRSYSAWGLLPWNTATGTVAYDAGTVDVKPTYKLNNKGLTLDLAVPYAEGVRMWMVYDGKSVELEGTVSDGKTSFTALYPFDMEFAFLTSYTNGSEWGTDYTAISDMQSPRAHCWNWDGGFIALWLDTELVKESRSYAVQADEHVLSGREHPAISFLASSEGRSFTSVTSTVTGVLMPDDKYGCTADDVEELLAAGHATYRSPSGRIATVAVTSADVTRSHSHVEVSIGQTEEQL